MRFDSFCILVRSHRDLTDFSLNVANCEVNIEVNVSDMILLSFSEVYVTVLSSSDLSINLVVFDLVESYFSLFFFVF